MLYESTLVECLHGHIRTIQKKNKKKTCRHTEQPGESVLYTYYHTFTLNRATETFFKCQQAFFPNRGAALSVPPLLSSSSHNPRGPQSDHLAGVSMLEEYQREKSDLLLQPQRSTTPTRLRNKGFFTLTPSKPLLLCIWDLLMRTWRRETTRAPVSLWRKICFYCDTVNVWLPLPPQTFKSGLQICLYPMLSDSRKQALWPVR